jgi:hypothetical protein
MLRKAKVLFLAADPFSLSGEKKRLELDRDVKKIQSKMREAEREYGRTLEFVWELAAQYGPGHCAFQWAWGRSRSHPHGS